jgi:site-specific DNA recombinase
VHGLLTNPVYSGRLRFNRRNARTGKIKIKDEAEHVHYEAEAIVSATEFDAVQNALAARNSRVAPPRVVSGPILLTGLATCARRGAGTSRSGEVYRYYCCNSALTKGKTACKGRSIRMDKLDRLVTGRLADKQGALDRRMAALAREAEDAGERLRRLYRLVEEGVAPMDAILKERIASLKATQEAALGALERAQSGARVTERIGPLALDRFTRLMRERINAGEIPFRKAYIRSIVDRIEVDDAVVRIMGRKDVLEQAVRSGGATPPVVHSFVPKWWARQDSNLQPDGYEPPALTIELRAPRCAARGRGPAGRARLYSRFPHDFAPRERSARGATEFPAPRVSRHAPAALAGHRASSRETNG